MPDARLRIAFLAPVAVALIAAGCGGDGEARVSADPASAALFTSVGCGDCHALADAGTSGTTGPDLDERAPTADQARVAMQTGPGLMVPFTDRLTPEQIEQLATYVDGVTG